MTAKKEPDNHEVIRLVGGSLDGQKLRVVKPCVNRIVLAMGSEVYVRNGETSDYLFEGNKLKPEVIHREDCDLDDDCSCSFTSWLRNPVA